MWNQPPIVTLVMILCGLCLLGMTIWEIHIDIRSYKYKKLLERKTDNRCPNCKKKLKIQNVDKQGYGDIDYFVYCDKCSTMYKIKYKEKLNDYESNNKRKVK